MSFNIQNIAKNPNMFTLAHYIGKDFNGWTHGDGNLSMGDVDEIVNSQHMYKEDQQFSDFVNELKTNYDGALWKYADSNQDGQLSLDEIINVSGGEQIDDNTMGRITNNYTLARQDLLIKQLQQAQQTQQPPVQPPPPPQDNTGSNELQKQLDQANAKIKSMQDTIDALTRKIDELLNRQLLPQPSPPEPSPSPDEPIPSPELTTRLKWSDDAQQAMMLGVDYSGYLDLKFDLDKDNIIDRSEFEKAQKEHPELARALVPNTNS